MRNERTIGDRNDTTATHNSLHQPGCSFKINGSAFGPVHLLFSRHIGWTNTSHACMHRRSFATSDEPTNAPRACMHTRMQALLNVVETRQYRFCPSVAWNFRLMIFETVVKSRVLVVAGRSRKLESSPYYSGLLAGHALTRELGEEVSKLSRGESGPVRRSHGSGWVGKCSNTTGQRPGHVGSGHTDPTQSATKKTNL